MFEWPAQSEFGPALTFAGRVAPQSLALSFLLGFWQNPRRLGDVTNFTFGMPLVLGNKMELASDRN